MTVFWDETSGSHGSKYEDDCCQGMTEAISTTESAVNFSLGVEELQSTETKFHILRFPSIKVLSEKLISQCN
jgi:hypothetical protein